MESDFAANICAISGWRYFVMKLALTLAATIAFAGAAFADPLEGTWRRPIDDNGNSGLVVVAPCGASCVARFHNHLTVQAHRWHRQISGARSFLIRLHPATVHVAVRSGRQTATKPTIRACS
jgi:hypothetical protein